MAANRHRLVIGHWSLVVGHWLSVIGFAVFGVQRIAENGKVIGPLYFVANDQ
jgi:hypothetical protein